jgi:hypothetical protein
MAAMRVRWVWCLDEGCEYRRWAAAHVCGGVVDIVTDATNMWRAWYNRSSQSSME